MTGTGVKEIMATMEQELRDLTTDHTSHATSEEWEPPSLERIKKRMGMTT